MVGSYILIKIINLVDDLLSIPGAQRMIKLIPAATLFMFNSFVEHTSLMTQNN